MGLRFVKIVGVAVLVYIAIVLIQRLESNLMIVQFIVDSFIIALLLERLGKKS